MKSMRQYSRRRCRFRPAAAILSGLLGLAAVPAAALEHELQAAPLWRSDAGGSLESSTSGAWLGGALRYGLRPFGPFWLRLGLEVSSAGGRSASGASELELTLLSWSGRIGAAWRLGRRLELGLEAGLSTERLDEELFPRGGDGRSVRSRLDGFGWGGALTASVGLGAGLRIPVQLSVQRLDFDRPVDDLTATQLGVSAGLAWRFGRAAGRR
jgi:hypothetical protein